MICRIEAHPDLGVAEITEAGQQLYRLLEGIADTFEHGMGIGPAVAERPFKVVYHREPGSGHPGAFDGSFTVEVAGIPFARVVQIANRAAPAILKAGKLGVRIGSRSRCLGRGFADTLL